MPPPPHPLPQDVRSGAHSYGPPAAVIGAGLCAGAFWVASEAANHSVILYGRHGWAPPELAFLLNFVLLGLPCAALLTTALARWWGPRLAAEEGRSLAGRRARAGPI